MQRARPRWTARRAAPFLEKALDMEGFPEVIQGFPLQFLEQLRGAQIGQLQAVLIKPCQNREFLLQAAIRPDAEGWHAVGKGHPRTPFADNRACLWCCETEGGLTLLQKILTIGSERRRLS